MYLAHLLSVLCVPLVLAVVDDDPYCGIRYKRLCQGKGRHIACQFADPGPGPSCENYTAIKFNSDLKHFILQYVNRRRQRIASGNERVRGGLHLPKPEIMMMVEWDRELAFLAQRLADQCNFVHDDCRATVRYPYAGQTVGEVRWRRSEEPLELGARRAIRRVFDAWWGERRRVQPQQITAPFRLTARGAVWGHFSQLAVWTLQAMGCGAVHHGSTHPRLLLVCDFSHTNMLGQRTLSPGPMAPCPVHFVRRTRQYPSLCAPVRHPIIIESEDIYEEEEEQEEDEDEDPGLTVGMITDAPTSTVKYLKFTKTRSRTTMSPVPLSVPKFREDLNFRPKGLLIETLDRELDRERKPNREDESKNKAFYKSRVTEDYVLPEMRQWMTRAKTYMPVWNENQDLIEVQPLPKKTTMLMVQDPNVLEFYRPKPETTEDVPMRQRWKQTRDRPKRPGESALLFTQTINHPKRLSVAPIMLDKDDFDQLFRDTGFIRHRETS